MPSTVFDSFYLKDRFGTPVMRAVWDDRATLQRWLDVEAALAQVEAELGASGGNGAHAVGPADVVEVGQDEEREAVSGVVGHGGSSHGRSLIPGALWGVKALLARPGDGG